MVEKRGRNANRKTVASRPSVTVSGQFVGSPVVIGNRNRVKSRMKDVRATAPGPIDLRAEISSIRKVVEQLELHPSDRKQSEDNLAVAEAEGAKETPDPQVIGRAVKRVLQAAQDSPQFGQVVARLAKPVGRIASWLGTAGAALSGILNQS